MSNNIVFVVWNTQMIMIYVDALVCVLDIINISKNKIGTEGAMAISKALQINSTLQTISLGYVMSSSVAK